MANEFLKSFDELLDAILTDYRNQFPGVDMSQGSLVFIKSACLASSLWGLYHYQEWISRQIFPDSANTESLEHHAWVRGLSRTYGETDAALLARLLDYIRRPPAGGNKYDYVKWSLEIDNVAAAYCFPIAHGLGTVDVVIVANEETTGSEIPSTSARTGIITTVSAGKLIDTAADFMAAERPVSAGDVVRNTVQGKETTVLSVDSATQLTLADDIFAFVGENYHVHFHCGTNTTATTGKLIDMAAAFNDATYTVAPGDPVENRTDGTETTVVSVDSSTQLTLADDIFAAAGKAYTVRSLVARVKEYIDDVRPVTASRVYVMGPAIIETDVTMVLSGADANAEQAAADVEIYMKGLIPGQTFYRAQLTAIGIQNGANNVTITAPAEDVSVTNSQMIRPGTIDVT